MTAPAAPLRSILGYTVGELREAFAEAGVQPFRASQVLQSVYRGRAVTWGAIPNLGRRSAEALAERFRVHVLECESARRSGDGTEKLVLRSPDGHAIETVIIPDGRRRTICVSSQVGCSLDCAFCATGRLGFGRNLRQDEIVDQWLHAALRLAGRGEAPTHVVFMGMGEPLLNLRSVVGAIRVLCDPGAAGLSHRRITVSTAGVVPRIAELGRETRARLAISLHATTDAVRDTLVPLNRRFPLAELLEACRRYPLARRDRISFEYTLISEVNDAPEDARRLLRCLRGIPAKVNLIPLNEHPGSALRRPGDAQVDRFAGLLAGGPIGVSVRRSRGDDIFAACGQLGAVAPDGAATGLSGPVR